MTETEADDVIRRLSDALAGRGFEWLSHEVAAAVQEGRRQEKIKVKRSRGRSLISSAVDDERPTSRQSAEFSRTIPYTSKEQLALLTDAIVGLFDDSASMNAALIEEFGTVVFEPELVIAEADRFVLDGSSLEAHKQVKERVSTLVKRLYAEASQ